MGSNGKAFACLVILLQPVVMPLGPGRAARARDEPPAASASAATPASATEPPVARRGLAAVDQPEAFVRAPATSRLTVLEVAHESIFGAADEADWRPLTLRTFFTEGWDRPWARAPIGSNGAPEQYLLGGPSAVFGRDVAVDTFYTNHLNNVAGLFLTPNAPFLPVHPSTTGNQYTGYTTAELPLNQRLMLYIGTAFINSNKTNPAGPYVGNWGDSEVQFKFRLVSQQNFSLLAFVGDRLPTGKTVNGSDINFVNEGCEFWFNFAPKWVLKGTSFINILTGRTTSTTVYINQLTIARYLTTMEARYFKQLVVYSTVSALSDISGGRGHVNDIYIFPAVRFSLDKSERRYILGGVNVPVSGPQPFAWQPQLAVYRYF